MDQIIIYIVVFFFIIGAIDKILGNRFGFGERFTAGLMTMGSLALAMIGIISLAPVIAALLLPVITPVYGLIGADPATFANTILAIDMGGHALAETMALTPDAGLFAWVFLGTTIGPTIVFSIPVALGIIKKEDQNYFAQGILIGLMTIPAGTLVGGLAAGFELEMLLRNLFPTIIISLLIGFGLWKKPKMMIKGFSVFGKLVEITAIVGLVAIVIETLTGFVVIPNLAPIEEGIQIVGTIAIFIAGAFPMVLFISRVLKRPLEKLGSYLGINDTATAGLIVSLAHIIPMLALIKEMNPRGKVINVAFGVSAAFVFGSHLGFVAGISPEMVFPMIVSKLLGGVTAVLLALFFLRKVGH
ncbi:ethanolamine utilization protein EutH [Ralstonia pickettii]|nr:ethanolamine utilization protein EutH [Ralstonia pickettii]